MTRPDRARSEGRARVSRRGAARWLDRGHPWIYRSDVLDEPADAPGAVTVFDESHRAIGTGLWSPASTIALRMLTRAPVTVDVAFWRERIARARDYRTRLAIDATAFRIVHAEADGLPSLVVDRYADVLVAQFLSAGIERHRADITRALASELAPAGILARDDVPIRRHEKLPGGTPVLAGDVPDRLEVREHDVISIVAPHTGQKTGAFLDQRENRLRARSLARGEALDAFSYHGSFALHMARGGARVTALESSPDAIGLARENARRNGLGNDIEFAEANVFDALRDLETRPRRFDVIVLDPPAFAKRRDNIGAAMRGYKEINLRAMKLLADGGHLLTFSCSYHVSAARFRAMLVDAAADAGRAMRWIEARSQAADHPVVLQVPESGYLKGAVLQAA